MEPRGAAGTVGASGAAGGPGATGAMGAAGSAGATGPSGSEGATGPTGANGSSGPIGPTGVSGPTGAASPNEFAHFYAVMPPDNAATVAVGAAIDFPNDGPNQVIHRSSANVFVLPAIGVYDVSWQVSVTEAAQLVLVLDGVEQNQTVVGRATGTSQIVGHALIQTTVIDSTLSLNNPQGNSTALTITPLAGGARPVSASLTIRRIL